MTTIQGRLLEWLSLPKQVSSQERHTRPETLPGWHFLPLRPGNFPKKLCRIRRALGFSTAKRYEKKGWLEGSSFQYISLSPTCPSATHESLREGGRLHTRSTAMQLKAIAHHGKSGALLDSQPSPPVQELIQKICFHRRNRPSRSPTTNHTGRLCTRYLVVCNAHPS
jgi:hypothetical protein